MEGKDFWILTAGIGGNIVEKVITVFAVRHGATEQNFFIASLIPYWGLGLALLLAGVIAAGSLIVAYLKRSERRWPLYTVSGLYVFLAVWNLGMIIAYNSTLGILVF